MNHKSSSVQWFNDDDIKSGLPTFSHRSELKNISQNNRPTNY